MRPIPRYLLLLLLACSCQLFETEKISTETFYEEELQSINWKDVDQYPVFAACESFSEKGEQKRCFERTLTAHIHAAISRRKIVSPLALHDTVYVDFTVSKTGKLSVHEFRIDSLTAQVLPDLKEWILQSMDSLQPIAPAYKRGIPVRTDFKLPIAIRTSDL
jgi:hypothetical protein